MTLRKSLLSSALIEASDCAFTSADSSSWGALGVGARCKLGASRLAARGGRKRLEQFAALSKEELKVP